MLQGQPCKRGDASFSRFCQAAVRDFQQNQRLLEGRGRPCEDRTFKRQPAGSERELRRFFFIGALLTSFEHGSCVDGCVDGRSYGPAKDCGPDRKED
jgi:hypothetical protein